GNGDFQGGAGIAVDLGSVVQDSLGGAFQLVVPGAEAGPLRELVVHVLQDEGTGDRFKFFALEPSFHVAQLVGPCGLAGGVDSQIGKESRRARGGHDGGDGYREAAVETVAHAYHAAAAGVVEQHAAAVGILRVDAGQRGGYGL